MSDDPASAEAFRWELEQEIERLKKTRDALTEERDNARRQYCYLMAQTHNYYAKGFAREYGWDCFEENSK